MNKRHLLAVILLAPGIPCTGWAQSEPTLTEGAPSTDPFSGITVTGAQKPTMETFRTQIIELRGQQNARPEDPDIPYRLGALYLEIGDPVAADEQLQRAVRLGSTQPDLWLLVARAWLLSGKLVEIQAQIDPDRLPTAAEKAELAAIQGLAWLEKGRTDLARESFRSALSLEPNHSPAYLGLARVSMAEGNLEAAADALTSAEAGAHPDPVEIATLRGELALANNDPAVAEAAFQSAVDAKPFQYWRRRQLAYAQIAGNSLDAADANIARILAVDPRDPAGAYLSGYSAYLRGDFQRAYDTISPTLLGQVDEVGALFIAGASAYRLGNYNQAQDLLEQYVQRQPNDATARQILAATLLTNGEPASALDALKPMLDLNPGAAALSLAGQAATLSGDARSGIGYLERAIQLSPEDANLSRLLGAAQIAAGDRESGIAQLEKVVASGAEGLEPLELALLQELMRGNDWEAATVAAKRFAERYPDNPAGWIVQGIVQARSNHLDAARSAFEQAAKVNPDNLDANIGLADVALRQGDPETAVTALERAAEGRPGDPLVTANLTGLELKLGRHEAAAKRVESALAANPRSPEIVLVAASVYPLAGRPLDALQLLRERGEPTSPDTLRLQGVAQLRAGDSRRAASTLEALTDQVPDSVPARILLGRARAASGDFRGAKDAFDIALEHEPQNPEAAIGAVRAELLALRATDTKAAAQRLGDKATRVLTNNPDSPDAIRLRALLAVFGGHPQSAIQWLATLYRAGAEAEVAADLAGAYLIAGDEQAATDLLERHLERFPKDIGVRLALAQVLSSVGRANESAKQLGLALQLDWDRPDVHLDLAELLVSAGRGDEARPHLAEALKALPDDPRVKSLQKKP